jgi:hypothetical protein
MQFRVEQHDQLGDGLVTADIEFTHKGVHIDWRVHKKLGMHADWNRRVWMDSEVATTRT